MSSLPSRQLLIRLHRDLSELHDSPYPGVSVFTNDADLRKFCLVLIPPSGPFKDLALHFDVELPDSWPSSPPAIRSSAHGIDHPNLFGGFICCDLLKKDVYREGGYNGGYSPALTLRGLFLQFLTFFSSTRIEQDYGGNYDIGDFEIKWFLREESLVQILLEGRICGDDDSYESQSKFAQEWDANPSPEVLASTYCTRQKTVLHKTKEWKSVDYSGKIHLLIFENPRWRRTLDKISSWSCKACPYGSSLLPHNTRESDFASVATTSLDPMFFASPVRCFLDILNDDVLHEISFYLPSESVIAFSQAYPRFDALTRSSRELLRRELTCFFLRKPIKDAVLGIGVALDLGSRTLSSDFDWLSEAAFVYHNVRKSIEKREFQYFLPLAFNRPHFERVEPAVWTRLGEIDRALRHAEMVIAAKSNRVSHKIPPPEGRHEVVRVIYRMMNNIVVSLMKSCDDAYSSSGPGSTSRRSLLCASEKAVYSYCHLFHLLICLSRTTPQVLQDAVWKVQQFISKPDARVKAKVPDLGEFIVNVTLVLALAPSHNLKITWSNIVEGLLQELTIRNVRWVLKDSPELEALEQGQSDYRLAMTFLRAKTSLRLLMFQVMFLDAFVKLYAPDLSVLDDNYGFAREEIPGHVVEKVKEIYAVNTWPAFFERVNYSRGIEFGPEKFSHLLRSAILTSAQRGYHNGLRPRQVHLLWRERTQKEKDWLRRRGKK
ncbi:hypothetical protein K435DRAFT_431565 [Dendrothele bispora CBS 962.96]|uniref:UBC core domain-containing protein n=1 Tax=Dendrothele bispora (strain CBS 962.96) TaxID=1314807 RepID=A0A4S8MFD0_DENBC|nr:hypothetical protein K435DRAFT_431565 [Dendrothele bispora CBS 962.96]